MMEPIVTESVERWVRWSGSAQLSHLQHRIKSPDSLARKIRSTPLPTGFPDIPDIARYTVVDRVGCLADRANALLDDARSEGWQCLALEHSYYDGSPYKGIHAVLRPDAAQAIPVELQFDSPESMLAKQVTRELYEQYRQDRRARRRLWPQRVQAWEQVPSPAVETLRFADRRVSIKTYLAPASGS